MGTRPELYDKTFLRERGSISANLKSAWLAFSMRLHTPFVRLLAEQTKVVTMVITPEYVWIWNVFAFYLFEIEEWLECSAGLKVFWKFFNFCRAQSHSKKFLTLLFRKRRPCSSSGFRGLGTWAFQLVVVVWESLEESGSEEQPGRGEKEESCREEDFMLRGLSDGLKRSLLDCWWGMFERKWW